MRIEHEGISIWYGTPDAPAPEGIVLAGNDLIVTIGVYPVDPSNAVEVHYQVNQSPTTTVAARYFWTETRRVQYFRASLPTFHPGDSVEYTALCRCAGRQVPPQDGIVAFTSSFRVVAKEIEEGRDRAKEPTSPSISSSSLSANQSQASATGSPDELEIRPDAVANDTAGGNSERVVQNSRLDHNDELAPPDIKHIVVLMLENRSFDSVLGYLYGNNANVLRAEPTQVLPVEKENEGIFDGLLYVDRSRLSNSAEYNNQIITQEPTNSVQASNSPGWDPGEEFEHVNMQLFEQVENPRDGTVPTMKGFLKDYSKICKGDEQAVRQIMHSYTSGDLPVLSALARGYAVSDRWFASVPTQTNANRAFSICGTSMGLVNNGEKTNGVWEWLFAADEFRAKTIFEVLYEGGMKDWGIFYTDIYPPHNTTGYCYTQSAFPTLQDPKYGLKFHEMYRFFERAKKGTLPKFSYLEPAWGGYADGWYVRGTDYHPPSDTTPGEEQLGLIYEALRSNTDAWNDTMFVVLFDEHGGTYDHVPPPWGATPPWGTNPPPPKPSPTTPTFGFNRFGVRVPAIVVSPYIEKSTVFRSPTNIPFDHTSMIATVLEICLPHVTRDQWGLGHRVAKAPSFNFLRTRSTPRVDDVLDYSPSTVAGILYGEPFYLQHQSGEYVTKAVKSTLLHGDNWYPTLGISGAMTFRLEGGWGIVMESAVSMIKTDEVMYFYGGVSKLTEYTGMVNALTHKPGDYVWYTQTNEAAMREDQYWRLEPVVEELKNTIPQKLERVRIRSINAGRVGEVVIKSHHPLGINEDYLMTSATGGDWFVIQPYVKRLEPVIERLRAGHAIQLGILEFIPMLEQLEGGDRANQFRRFLQDSIAVLSKSDYESLESNGYGLSVGRGEIRFHYFPSVDRFQDVRRSLLKVVQEMITKTIPVPAEMSGVAITLINNSIYLIHSIKGQSIKEMVVLSPNFQ